MASRSGRPGAVSEWGDIRKALFKSPVSDAYNSPGE